jgi:hypothetical protein
MEGDNTAGCFTRLDVLSESEPKEMDWSLGVDCWKSVGV